jgi:hypothetical protein
MASADVAAIFLVLVLWHFERVDAKVTRQTPVEWHCPKWFNHPTDKFQATALNERETRMLTECEQALTWEADLSRWRTTLIALTVCPCAFAAIVPGLLWFIASLGTGGWGIPAIDYLAPPAVGGFTLGLIVAVVIIVVQRYEDPLRKRRTKRKPKRRDRMRAFGKWLARNWPSRHLMRSWGPYSKYGP